MDDKQELREAHAEELFDGAQRAARAGYPETAAEISDLAHKTLHPYAQDDMMMDAVRDVVRGKAVGKLFSDIDELPVSYLWDPWIPYGKVTVLAGGPGSRKSTLSCALATLVTLGARMPDGSDGASEPGGVVMINVEDDSEDSTVTRLRVHGADMTKVLDLSRNPRPVTSINDPADSPFKIPDDFPLLKAAITQIGAHMVVIDNLGAVTRSSVSTFRKQSLIEKIMQPLRELARETGVAIILIAHFTKGGGNDPIGRIEASAGLTTDVRSVIVLTPDGADPTRTVLSNPKNSYREKPMPMVFTQDRSGRIVWVSGLLPSFLEEQRTDTLNMSHKRILELLESQDRLWSVQVITQQMEGLNAPYIRNALSRMVARGQIANPVREMYCTHKAWAVIVAEREAEKARKNGVASAPIKAEQSKDVVSTKKSDTSDTSDTKAVAEQPVAALNGATPASS